MAKYKPRHAKKSNIPVVLSILVITISLGVLIYSGLNIFKWKENNDENNKIKDQTNKLIKDDTNINAALSDITTDAKGYLKVPNTKINYVVVQGKDNSYYLKHNLKKEYNISGWIFFDYRDKLDGTDKNIIIYGHDTKNGSMFGSLKNILNKSWQEKNKEVYLKINDQDYTYKIFSVYQIEKENYYIRTTFNNDFEDFIKTLKKRSIYDFKVNPTENDQILTLSTCSSDGTHRVVLHAIKE